MGNASTSRRDSGTEAVVAQILLELEGRVLQVLNDGNWIAFTNFILTLPSRANYLPAISQQLSTGSIGKLIHKASCENNLVILELIIERIPFDLRYQLLTYMDPTDDFLQPPVQVAVIHGFIDQLKLLIKSVDWKIFDLLSIQNASETGHTAIHCAIVNGRVNEMECMLAAIGNKFNLLWITDKEGRTPLHLAIACENPVMVCQVISNLKPQNIYQLLLIEDYNKETPVHYVLEKCNLEVLHDILKDLEPAQLHSLLKLKINHKSVFLHHLILSNAADILLTIFKELNEEQYREQCLLFSWIPETTKWRRDSKNIVHHTKESERILANCPELLKYIKTRNLTIAGTEGSLVVGETKSPTKEPTSLTNGIASLVSLRRKPLYFVHRRVMAQLRYEYRQKYGNISSKYRNLATDLFDDNEGNIKVSAASTTIDLRDMNASHEKSPSMSFNTDQKDCNDGPNDSEIQEDRSAPMVSDDDESNADGYSHESAGLEVAPEDGSRESYLPPVEEVQKLFNKPFIYPMSCPVRGRALILHIDEFDTKANKDQAALEYRAGSEQDRECMRDLFTWLGFEVVVRENPTAERILEMLNEEINNDKHGQYGMFALIILSHGDRTLLYGADSRSLTYDEIYEQFSPNSFPSMSGKPKLVITQACAGSRKDTIDGTGMKCCYTVTTQRYPCPMHCESFEPRATSSRKDLIHITSSFPGYRSARDEKRGSCFIRKLYEVFKQYGAHLAIHHLFQLVAGETIKETAKLEYKMHGVQTPTLSPYTALKDLYFFPNYNPKQSYES